MTKENGRSQGAVLDTRPTGPVNTERIIKEQQELLRHRALRIEDPQKQQYADILIDEYPLYVPSSVIKAELGYTLPSLQKDFQNLSSAFRNTCNGVEIAVITRRAGRQNSSTVRNVINGVVYEPIVLVDENGTNLLPFPQEVSDMRPIIIRRRGRDFTPQRVDNDKMQELGDDMIRLIVPRLLESINDPNKTSPLSAAPDVIINTLSIGNSDEERMILNGIENHVPIQILVRAFVDRLEEHWSNVEYLDITRGREWDVRVNLKSLIEKGVELNAVVQAVCRHFRIEIPYKYMFLRPSSPRVFLDEGDLKRQFTSHT